MDILPAGRRRFLCGATALGAGCALWQRTGSLFAQSAPALVPRRTYFVQPDYQSVRISPDGKHLAYLAPVNGVRNLFVAPIADPRGGRQITRVTDRDIGTWYAWAYTNRHIVFFQERDGDENLARLQRRRRDGRRQSAYTRARGAFIPAGNERPAPR